MTTLTSRILLAFLSLAAAALAQDGRPGGVTTLVMGFDVGNGIIPAAPGSRVRVPPLERVVLTILDASVSPLQWTKDGKSITGATERSYTIPFATTADSGRYSLTGTSFPIAGFFATGITLDIVPAGHVGNFSMRLELAAGPTTQITGFVVGGSTPKSLLIRAVGPSLKQFGIAKPVARPRIRFYDSSGRDIVFTYPAIVVDIGAFFTSVGAFPLVAGEADAFAFDYGTFQPGSYTIHVSDASGQGGTVLVEAYEFSVGPQSPTPTPVTLPSSTTSPAPGR